MRCVGLEPIYNEKSRILILGTMPGAKSLECGEYYSDKKNVFWKILFEIFQEKEIYDYKDKKQFLLEHHIALWDVLKECDRDKKDGSESSSDRYIYNDIPNDISTIIKESNICLLYTSRSSCGLQTVPEGEGQCHDIHSHLMGSHRIGSLVGGHNGSQHESNPHRCV